MLRTRTNALAEEFCDEWAGYPETERRPLIEEYLGKVEPPERLELLGKLMEEEVCWRRDLFGDDADPDEYVNRLRPLGLPGMTEVVYEKTGWHMPPDGGLPSTVLLVGGIALETGALDRNEVVDTFKRWSKADEPLPTFEQVAFDGREGDGQAAEALSAAVKARLRACRNKVEEVVASLRAPDLDWVHTSLIKIRKKTPALRGLEKAFGLVPGSRFVPISYLGGGGGGSVFLAKDKELDRDVVLKVLLDEDVLDPEKHERFDREVRIGAQLEHPGIAAVYGRGQYGDGRPYFAMRRFKGGTLADAIARLHAPQVPRRPKKRTAAPRNSDATEGKGRSASSPAPTLRDLIEKLIVVCNAVGYAHQQGIIHRDLKPRNILLGDFGETMIADWGLAKRLGIPDELWLTGTRLVREMISRDAEGRFSTSGDPDVTSDGEIIGTLAYLSPEQASIERRSVTHRSDIYSLGAILYEILTGRKAFASGPGPGDGGTTWSSNDLSASTGTWVAAVTRREQVRETLARIQLGQFPRPREVDVGVHGDLEAVCLKAMTLHPDARYLTARDMAADLERWLAGDPVKARREPVQAMVWRLVVRHRVLATAAVIALIASVAAYNVAAAYYRAMGLLARLNTPGWEHVPVTVGDLRSRLWIVRNDLAKQVLGRDIDLRVRAALALFSLDRSQSDFLIDRLNRCDDEPGGSEEAHAIRDVLIEADRNRPEDLVGLLPGADPEQFRKIVDLLASARHAHRAGMALEAMLTAAGADDEREAVRRGKVAAALMIIGRPDRVWPLFRHAADPSVRTELISSLAALKVDPRLLIDRVTVERREGDVSALRALVVALGEYRYEDIPAERRGELMEALGRDLLTHPDAGLHSAIEWLFTAWELRGGTQPGDIASRASDNPPGTGWSVNANGMTMAVIAGPRRTLTDRGTRTFWIGSPVGEESRQSDETHHEISVPDPFELATREVTVELFLQFLDDPQEPTPDFDRIEVRDRIKRYSGSESSLPAVGVTWKEAAMFCNWLSRKNGLPECYRFYTPKDGEVKRYLLGVEFLPNQRGYRLPTEVEWEFACRAGTVTPWPFGRSEDRLGRYGWYGKNSVGPAEPGGASAALPPMPRPHRVGLLRPNEFGLFDMLGNALEWTQDVYAEYGASQAAGGPVVDRQQVRVFRGGAFDREAANLRSAYREFWPPTQANFITGLRPARSLLPPAPRRPATDVAPKVPASRSLSLNEPVRTGP